MKKKIFLILLLSSVAGFSQTLKTVKELEAADQQCFDKGAGLACSIEYYKQMDALLNKAYHKLKSNLNSEERAKLKKEQLLWIKNRDAYFEKQYGETAEVLGTTEGEDFKMIIRHTEAEFVKARAIQLIKRL